MNAQYAPPMLPVLMTDLFSQIDGSRHAYVVNTGFEPVEVDLGRFGKLRLDSYELRYLR